MYFLYLVIFHIYYVFFVFGNVLRVKLLIYLKSTLSDLDLTSSCFIFLVKKKTHVLFLENMREKEAPIN